MFPVAVLPGQSTFTMSFTSGKFDTNLFSMANAIKDRAESADDHAWRTNSDYVMSTGERHEVNKETHKIELLNTPISTSAGTSVYIAGLEETTGSGTIVSGKFRVDGKNVQFSSDDDIDFVDVVYDYKKEVVEAIITNKESAIGEAVCLWPVKLRGLVA